MEFRIFEFQLRKQKKKNDRNDDWWKDLKDKRPHNHVKPDQDYDANLNDDLTNITATEKWQIDRNFGNFSDD